MKNKIRNITAILFATFLFFAALETIFVPAKTASADNREESDTLEVPLTGSPNAKNLAGVYENLIEIAFLALTGAGFCIKREKEAIKNNKKE